MKAIAIAVVFAFIVIVGFWVALIAGLVIATKRKREADEKADQK